MQLRTHEVVTYNVRRGRSRVVVDHPFTLGRLAVMRDRADDQGIRCCSGVFDFEVEIAAYVANLARGDILTATDSVEH